MREAFERDAERPVVGDRAGLGAGAAGGAGAPGEAGAAEYGEGVFEKRVSTMLPIPPVMKTAPRTADAIPRAIPMGRNRTTPRSASRLPRSFSPRIRSRPAAICQIGLYARFGDLWARIFRPRYIAPLM